MVQELCKEYLWGGSAEEEVGGWQVLVVLSLKKQQNKCKTFCYYELTAIFCEWKIC